MENQKNVEALALLLKKPKEAVSKALEEDGGMEAIVSDFKTDNQVFDLKEFATLKTNFRKETVDNLKEEDIPEAFKNKAIGWKLEKLENEIKESYQFTDEHKGLTDLVDQIVTKAKTPSNNEEEVKTLKQTIVDLEKDYGAKLGAQQTEFDSSLIKSDFNKAINGVGLDYEEDKLKKQKGLLKAAFKDAFTLKRLDGKTVTLKGEDIQKDNKLDPLPLDELVLGVAKDFGFQIKSPEPGGHGGSSSKSKAGLKGVSFAEYAEKNGIKAHISGETKDKLYDEWKAAQ